jgi:FkbM family methyltransferase
MNKLQICRWVSTVFPPMIASYFTQFYYPFQEAIKSPVSFVKKSVTGSPLSCSTDDYHGFSFAIHGFFDWRNILIAKAITENMGENLRFDIIEIGANIGTETIGFADILQGRGTVHAFEPLESNLDELYKNCRLNPDLSIKVYPVAIGKNITKATFLIPPKNYSGMGKITSQNSEQNSNKITVDVFPLDSYLNDFNNPKALFIDVEGYEPLVLEGSIATLQKFKPVVILEVSSPLLSENGYSNKNIFDFFNNIGYNCYNIGRISIKKVEEISLYKFERHTNWICIPNEMPDLIGKIRKKIYSYHVRPLKRIV